MNQFKIPSQLNKKLLLHSCCGPCSTACIMALSPYFEITVFFYNPNITDKLEYEKRKAEQIRFIKESPYNVNFLEGDYVVDDFYCVIKGLENEPEGGARCKQCIALRLKETLKVAEKLQMDYFCSTLSVSPHKNSEYINNIGNILSQNSSVMYLENNFKKDNGYLKSIQQSKQYNLYRQNFCGCEFSKN